MQLHFRLNDCSGGTATVTTLSSVNTTETCATTMAVKIVGSSPTSNHLGDDGFAVHILGSSMLRNEGSTPSISTMRSICLALGEVILYYNQTKVRD